MGKKLEPKSPVAAVLPVLEGGAVSKNASRQGQMSALRVTSLTVLAECPRQWQAKYVHGEGTGSSKAGNLGTIVHEIVEAFFTGRLFLEDRRRQDAINQRLERLDMPIKEIQALWDYLWLSKDDLPHVMAVEHEFTLPVIDGALPLRGHIDLVLKHAGGITIVDHKTNRRAQSLNWWRQQLQPLAYAWAARRLWPGHEISFRIGYVNLGSRVEWKITEADDILFEARFSQLWQQFVTYQNSTGSWPAKLNDKCQYCPVNPRCPTFINQGQSFIDSLGIK